MKALSILRHSLFCGYGPKPFTFLSCMATPWSVWIVGKFYCIGMVESSSSNACEVALSIGYSSSELNDTN